MNTNSDKITRRRMTASMFRGVKLLSQHIPRLFPVIVLHSLLLGITPYVTVYLSAQIVNELCGNRDPKILWTWVVVTVVFEAASALVNAIVCRYKESRWDLLFVSANAILTDKMQSVDYAFVEDQPTRDLLHRVRENMYALGLGLNQVPGMLQDLLTSIVGMISAVLLTWQLFLLPVPDSGGVLTLLNHPLVTVAAMSAVLLLVWSASWMSQHSRRMFHHETDHVVAANRLYTPFYDVMFDAAKAADVRMYRQDILITRYMKQADDAVYGKDGRLYRFRRGLGGVFGALSTAVSALLMGCSFAFAVLKSMGGAFGLGQAVMYVGALSTFSKDVSMLLQTTEQIRMNTPYLETVFSFLDIPCKMYRGSLTTEKRADRDYTVEFRDVSFRYPGREEYALNHVSVTFRVGSRLAVVGRNGSGKSTLIKLLCRLYDPTEGEILLNGIDIRKYRYDEYIRLFAVVFQDFELLSQSLGSNVAASASFDSQRVEKSLENAGFGLGSSKWDQRLDAMLYRAASEDGVTPSAGEAQKIAIARALYKDAPFIVLDEPTAALDPLAEAEIYTGLDRIVGDKTAIYISHRLASCRFCDEILVFNQGNLVQCGTHDALVQITDGEYHTLWNAQAQYYTQ